MVKTRHSGGDIDGDLNESTDRIAVSNANRTNKNECSRTKESNMNVSFRWEYTLVLNRGEVAHNHLLCAWHNFSFRCFMHCILGVALISCWLLWLKCLCLPESSVMPCSSFYVTASNKLFSVACRALRTND